VFADRVIPWNRGGCAGRTTRSNQGGWRTRSPLCGRSLIGLRGKKLVEDGRAKNISRICGRKDWLLNRSLPDFEFLASLVCDRTASLQSGSPAFQERLRLISRVEMRRVLACEPHMSARHALAPLQQETVSASPASAGALRAQIKRCDGDIPDLSEDIEPPHCLFASSSPTAALMVCNVFDQRQLCAGAGRDGNYTS